MRQRRDSAAGGELEHTTAEDERLARPLAGFAGAAHFAAIGWKPYTPSGPEDQEQRRLWMYWAQAAERRRQTAERRNLRIEQIRRMTESIGEGAAAMFPPTAVGSDGDDYDNGD